MIQAKKHRFVALMGFSGVGKTTLMRMAAEWLATTCYIVRTTLSREPRDEWERKTFHFVSREDILALRHDGGLVHYEMLFGHLYALTREDADDPHQQGIGLICLTPEGIGQLRAVGYDVRAVLITSERRDTRGEAARLQEEGEQDLQQYSDFRVHNPEGTEGLTAAFAELCRIVLDYAKEDA